MNTPLDRNFVTGIARKSICRGINQPTEDPSRCERTILRAIAMLLEEHRPLFCTMVSKLQDENFQVLLRSFEAVMKNVFVDNQFNYGRMTMVLALAEQQIQHRSRVSGVVTTGQIEELAALIGEELVVQITSCQRNTDICLERFEHFCTDVIKRLEPKPALPWDIINTVFAWMFWLSSSMKVSAPANLGRGGSQP